MSDWLLVAGDFTPLGGMDRANHALAAYLAGVRGARVHLVTHRAWPDLAGHPRISVHRVWRPLGSHALGKPLLAARGRRVARALATSGARVVVNGGNCAWPGVNWVHYVHAAFDGAAGLAAIGRARDLDDERRALAAARIVVCNSRRTRGDVIERLGIPADRTHVVYYGVDAARFRPPTDAERRQARAALGLATDRPLASFVGALGDRRKGFDTLFAAWRALCAGPGWDVDLAVAGRGRELDDWRRRAAGDRLDARVRFLGFREDVATLLAASDVLVHPARYEAYGLAVHEALCAAVPAIVTATAGVAERYPADMTPLLLADPDDDGALADRLREWRRGLEAWRQRARALSETLRQRTWDAMAKELVALAEAAA